MRWLKAGKQSIYFIVALASLIPLASCSSQFKLYSPDKRAVEQYISFLSNSRADAGQISREIPCAENKFEVLYPVFETKEGKTQSSFLENKTIKIPGTFLFFQIEGISPSRLEVYMSSNNYNLPVGIAGRVYYPESKPTHYSLRVTIPNKEGHSFDSPLSLSLEKKKIEIGKEKNMASSDFQVVSSLSLEDLLGMPISIKHSIDIKEESQLPGTLRFNFEKEF